MAPLNIPDVSKHQSDSAHRRAFKDAIRKKKKKKKRLICCFALHALRALAMHLVQRHAEVSTLNGFVPQRLQWDFSGEDKPG